MSISWVFLEYCSPVWWPAAEYHLQLLEWKVYSVARLCHDQSFFLLCHCPCCYNIVWASICFYLSSTYSSCCRSSSIGVWFQDVCLSSTYARHRFVHMWNGLPTLCLTSEHWMGIQECSQPLVASLSCVFLSLPWRSYLWGWECNL